LATGLSDTPYRGRDRIRTSENTSYIPSVPEHIAGSQLFHSGPEK